MPDKMVELGRMCVRVWFFPVFSQQSTPPKFECGLGLRLYFDFAFARLQHRPRTYCTTVRQIRTGSPVSTTVVEHVSCGSVLLFPCMYDRETH